MTGGTTERAQPRFGERRASDIGHAASERRRQVRYVLIVVLVLNLAVAAAKIVFGYLTGSLAISADGFQSLLDGASNVVALVGLAIAARPPDPNHAYGHGRFETLAALGIAGLMLITLTEIVRAAWDRLAGGGAPDVTITSFVVMAATVGVNVVAVVWEGRAGRRLSSSMLTADARNTTSNILVSLSVVVSLVLVRLGFGRADALLSLLIALVIAWVAWAIVRDAALVLTDATPVEQARIERVVRAVPGVEGAHNIRSRGGEGSLWVDLHIQVDPAMPVDRAHDIASEVAERVEAELGDPADVTVHVEPADERHLRDERGHIPGSAGRG